MTAKQKEKLLSMSNAELEKAIMVAHFKKHKIFWRYYFEYAIRLLNNKWDRPTRF